LTKRSSSSTWKKKVTNLEEKSYKEIAEIIGITATNVATKLNRIKEKIKQNINQTYIKNGRH